VTDTQPPQIADGFPTVGWNAALGVVVTAFLNTAVPETAKASLQYGIGALSASVPSTRVGWVVRHHFRFTDLQDSATYQYTVTVTDPAGLSTTSQQLTFQTPAQTPFSSPAPSVTDTVLFWQFDNGGEAIAYHDSDPSNFNQWQVRADTGY
jgi:hypothetical protein